MTSSGTALLAGEYPISHALLHPKALMTPRLQQLFGDVYVRQTDHKDDGDRVVRASTIYQSASDAPLLKAKLEIVKSALPDGFLAELLAGTKPFGALLIAAGIEVEIANLRLFRTTGAQADGWGRQHQMIKATTNKLLCNVEERLENEGNLQNLLLPSARDIFIRTA